MEERPYIHLIEKDGLWYSFFAIRLASITAFDPSFEKYNEFSFKLLNKQIDFINSLDCPEDERTFELRFISHPDKILYTRGTINVALITKVSNSDKNISISKAEEIFHDIWSMLSTLSDYYEFEWITSEDNFLSIYKPFDIQSIIEIMRREDIIEIETAKRIRGFDIKNDVDRISDNNLYFTYPFIWSNNSLSRVFNVMLFQEEPCFLSACLKPVRFNEKIEEFYLKQINFCEKYLTGRGGIKPVNARIEFINQTLHGLFLRLEDSPFLMKIRVASKGEISEALIDSIGVEITEHSGSPDLIKDVNAAYVFSGGYDCYYFKEKKELSREIENMKMMNFDHTVGGLISGENAQIRYLFDSNQANCAFRLPIPQIKEFPGIETRFYKKVLPPSDIPSEGILIGKNVMHGQEQYVKLAEDDRRRHMYIVGQTGTGKSTLLLRMILQDINNDKGVAVLDPHGELINEILPRIPEWRIEDVIYINLEDIKKPIVFNMLEFRDELEKDFAVGEMIEIFDKIYDLRQTGGPIFEQYMVNALYLVMGDPASGSTLLEVIKVFTEPKFREYKLSKCKSNYVREFWEGIAERAGGDVSLQNIAPYITSKLTKFIYNTVMKNIISSQNSSFDMRKVMDEEKIFLVDLCKARLGSINSNFLGMVLVGKILIAALSRRDMKDRASLKDFYLYVDEFQNLATKTFISIISETRKYRLNVIMANQYLTQVSEEIRDAVMGNVGTLVSFRVGIKDAEILENKFYPIFTKHDLTYLPNFRVCMSMLAHGESVRPFEIQMIPEESQKNDQKAEKIKRLSAEKYGRNPRDLEKEIKLRWLKVESENT